MRIKHMKNDNTSNNKHTSKNFLFRKSFSIKNLSTKVKVITAFILGLVVSGGAAYAATILMNADQVGFDKTNTSLSSTDVQGALDELYARADTWLNPNDMGTPQYYAFGQYKGWCSSTDTDCNSYADFPTTSTTPPSGKNVYAVKYEDGQYGVCMQRNGKEHCFRARNYKAEAKHVQEVFSDISCNVLPSFEGQSVVACIASDFRCTVYADGGVNCYDIGTRRYCGVNAGSNVNCTDM